ncbi:hypothetical protein BGZ82_009978 [Podila clonocystis]|nr:hypothetical protein BGZ82_009978 [Podila clonocystis]
MIVPNNARTIRGTALFEVTCFVVVSMLLGAFSGELSVEIPVKICHPVSLTPAPKPKLEQNHLPHLYNLVDEDMDDDAQSRRIGSSTSLAMTGDDGDVRIGRQGEWNADEPQLSPANSITSIKSLLKNPKDKLSRLADKIQRSTSPTSSSHLNHEHRHGSKHNERPESPRRVVKSPALGPAMPIAYVPAVERVRYTPFQPPPTTKAKEFLKAAAQYQQEMAIGGAFAGMGGDNQEFDFDDKTMATAIHQWISRKESESMRPSSPPNMIQAPRASRPTPPVPIPASPNRKRPTVDRIDTRSIGSFSSHQSPSSPQSYDSPSSPTAQGFSPQSSRFIQHAHRQPAAPQTSAFGSAPEDCSTTPPLFAKPLPLPSPPPTGSPHRPGRDGFSAPQHPRPVSPIPIPIQSPESIALAREAYERVKRIGSPVQNPLANALTPTSSVPKSSEFLAQQQHPQQPQQNAVPLEVDLTIKIPVPQRSPIQGAMSPSSPSELSRLLSESAPTATVHHPKHGRDGHTVETIPPEPCSSPELRHVPMNRPLPVPGPKPQNLNQSGPAVTGTRSAPPRPRPEPAKRPPVDAPTTGSNISPASNVQSVQQNAFVPKAASLSLSGAAPVARRPLPSPAKPIAVNPPPPAIVTAQQQQQSSQEDAAGNQGFVYPRATRKPVLGAKPPSVAAKPKALAAQTPRLGDGTSARQETQELKMLQTASMRAPQLIAGNTQTEEHQVTRGFQARSERTVEARQDTVIEEEETREEAQNDDGRDPELARRLAAPLAPSASQMRGSGHLQAPHQQQQRQQERSPASGRRESSKENRPLGDHHPQHRHHDTPRYENPNRRHDRRGGAHPIASSSPPSRTHERAMSPERPVLTREQRQRQTNQQHPHQRQEPYLPESQKPGITTTTAQATTVEESTSYVSETTEEEEAQTQSEIRAQAIAAAHSFRATGAMVNSGGYAVDTGKLRQVMHEANSSSNNNSSSGHLISALAEGARNAVSGLGWKAASSPPTSGHLASPQRATSPSRASNLLQQQQQQHQRRAPGARPAESRPSREREQRPAVIPEQSHDLTMKDINFQTITPHNQSHHAELPKVSDALGRAPLQARGNREIASRDDICTHSHNRPAITTSPPGSRVLPQASKPIASTSALSTLNLDKTLPKIQEDKPSRSKIIERPESSTSASASSSSLSSSSAGEQSAPVRSKFFERPDKRVDASSPSGRNGPVVAKNLPHPPSTPPAMAPAPAPRTRGVIADLGLSGQQGQGAKAINPKLQEYIQKYNLAANTRG